ncbi:ThuA domain-containing protein [bacterium]|nr:ThuA domain-containing protein [bacterium]
MKLIKVTRIATILIATLGLAWLSMAADEKQTKKHIVFLVGDDLKHASGTHEFYAGAMLLQDSLAKGPLKDQVTTTVVNNWPEDTSVFDTADVIVHYYRGAKFHFMNKNHALIDKLAEKGTGQLFIHFAVDPEPEAEEFIKKWSGAVYKTGFSSNPHWDLKAKLENHPINSGIQQIELRDEWYVKMDYEGECALGYSGDLETGQVHAVMSGTPDAIKGNRKVTRALAKNPKPSDLTVFWAKEGTSGTRGAGVTGAHFHANWADDHFRKQVLNAITWCAHLPVPKDGVSSPAITEDLLNANLDKRKPKFKRLKLSAQKAPL